MDATLIAFENIVAKGGVVLSSFKEDARSTNQSGNPLERFIKDAFASCIDADEATRAKAYETTFSYTGNSSNPPDAMVRGDVAIETKKSESLLAEIQLNSSPPKRFLRRTDSRILARARDAEIWTKKPLVYAVGTVKQDDLKRLWLIFGECLVAEDSYYEKIARAISDAMKDNAGIKLRKTNELASVTGVDPRQRTSLRVRGMWLLMNPNKAFPNLVSTRNTCQYYLLMPEASYQKASKELRNRLESKNLQGYQNRLVEIVDPSDVTRKMEARFISYEF